MCALSAQHTKHGSLFSDDLDLVELTAGISSYLSEATSLISLDVPDQLNLDLIRSYGFLALYGTQIANSTMTHKYLGLYQMTCAMFSFHDESRWDDKLGVCDVEMRRRLYWAMYRLEVHSACVMGHMIRLPEAQSNVGYPVGLHHPAFVPGRNGDFEDWFAGWNATTDLYRILEHAIIDFRASRTEHTSILQHRGQAPKTAVQQSLSKVQETLSPQFGQIFDRSSDSGKNRCGFQATKIVFTIYLVRMFSLISAGANLDPICEAAEDMIANISNIPSEYIRASGVPIQQELAGVGHILGTIAAKRAKSKQDALRLHALLQSFATFLEDTAAPNSVAIKSAFRLRTQMQQIEERMVCDTNLESPQDNFDIQSEPTDPSIQFDCGTVDPFIASFGLSESLLANYTRPHLETRDNL